MDVKDMCKYLVRLRKERGIGLRELSRTAGLSPSSLSAIEKGQSSPTLATLHKVLKALETDFAEFFSKSDLDKSPVFRAGDMRTIEDKHRKYILLFPKRDDLRFEIVHETIALTETESEWEIHDFDIGGVILESGSIRLEIEGEGEWVMKKGDGFYVKAGLKHRATNLGDGPLHLITVAAPPRY